jgi:hypothetical protein
LGKKQKNQLWGINSQTDSLINCRVGKKQKKTKKRKKKHAGNEKKKQNNKKKRGKSYIILHTHFRVLVNNE